MRKRAIYITENDKSKLKKLLSSTAGFREQDKKTLQDLKFELERAIVVDEGLIDDNIIRMNSTVLLKDMQTRAKHMYKLVYPDEANMSENKISILAPIGTALLGFQVGDLIEWNVPAGKRKLKVQGVLTPDLQTEQLVEM
jgi:regulator of nucleoside diphosphate kinase